ncbi:hypothetical protein FACS1894199_18340 [Bacteroidia bacterium]|nr:hypothetical protein FACS1894199_18340 [Bacteroidia bacterium]
MNKKETINVQGTEVALYSQRKDQYISLTDMAKFKNSEIPATVISHWMSTVFSVNFMGIWEKMNNPNFNLTGFSEVKNANGRLVMTPKRWVELTNAIGKHKRIAYQARTSAGRAVGATQQRCHHTNEVANQ